MINALSSTQARTPMKAAAQAPAAGTLKTQATTLRDRFLGTSGSFDSVTMLGRAAVAANTAVKGGAEALPSVQGVWTALKSMDISGVWNGVQALGKASLSWGVKSAGIQGAISLVANGYRAFSGRESWSQAGTNVVLDSVGGLAGGIGGAIAGGAGSMLLTMLGVAGGPLTIGAALIGMGGYFLAERALKSTRIYRTFANGVSQVMNDAFRPFAK